MKYIDYAREGLSNLYYSRLRSILALLGVLVGTASVVAMVLGGEMAANEALKQFKALGTDLLAVSINSAPEQENMSTTKLETLTLEQALAVNKMDKHILTVAPYTQVYSPITYEGDRINGMIIGVTGTFGDIAKMNTEMGRFISAADKYEFYCVIGHDIYEQIKKIAIGNPIGKQLQIGKNIFIIAGVVAPWQESSFINASVDSSIMIPLLASTTMSKYAQINNIILRLSPDADIAAVQSHITNYFSGVAPSKQVMMRSAKELIAKMAKQSDILTVLLGLIGGISLIVGGIGVMNIMLVSVVERRREIGIRMAVGATRFDVGALFLMEAIMLALVGGIAGVLVGILIAYFISLLWHWEFMLFLLPPLAGFSVSTIVGIFFGFYPAYLASKLDPIEALRSE